MNLLNSKRNISGKQSLVESSAMRLLLLTISIVLLARPALAWGCSGYTITKSSEIADITYYGDGSTISTATDYSHANWWDALYCVPSATLYVWNDAGNSWDTATSGYGGFITSFTSNAVQMECYNCWSGGYYGCYCYRYGGEAGDFTISISETNVLANGFAPSTKFSFAIVIENLSASEEDWFKFDVTIASRCLLNVLTPAAAYNGV